jgi:hypothetical protein
MATSVPSNTAAIPVSRPLSRAKVQAAEIPWYMWCAVAALMSIMIGGQWDISWHSSIGRDTFWTPAHMAIYLGGLLSGVAFGFVILHTTFAVHSPLREASVRIWGFRAPLGAFIAAWGGITMLVSAPFDNWWHNAYGLDVKIISPPHVVLFLGIYAIHLGTMLLVSAHISRLNDDPQAPPHDNARWLFLCVSGLLLTLLMVMLMETVSRPYLHQSTPYIVLAALTPITLTLGARVSRLPFAASFVAGFYTLVNIALIQILPLFPAEPKLGPVYQHVTSFVPPPFPVLLIIPAFALDLLWQRTPHWGAWKTALVGGVVYSGLLIISEWFFASFLMSPAAAKPFWGTIYLYYALPPQSYMARNLFFPEPAAQLAFGFLLAAVAASLSIRWALSRGEWMRAVKR